MLKQIRLFLQGKGTEDLLPEGTEFNVIVDEFPVFNLCYDKRKDALVYKQIIKKSKPKLQGHIMRTEFTDGFITDTKEVYWCSMKYLEKRLKHQQVWMPISKEWIKF